MSSAVVSFCRSTKLLPFAFTSQKANRGVCSSSELEGNANVDAQVKPAPRAAFALASQPSRAHAAMPLIPRDAPAETSAWIEDPGTNACNAPSHASGARVMLASCTEGLVPPETQSRSAANVLELADSRERTETSRTALALATPHTSALLHTRKPDWRARSAAIDPERTSTTLATSTPASRSA